jgi:TPR repeat protein
MVGNPWYRCITAIVVLLFMLPHVAAEEPKDGEQLSMLLIQIAARAGEKENQVLLGDMYYFGWGLPQDEKEAAAWFRRAAEQGHAVAALKLGNMYHDGRGVQEDRRLAIEWWKQSADRLEPAAMFNLGVAYDEGYGVPVNDALAILWWSRAALLGNADAAWNIGLAYLKGDGVSLNEATAVAWFQRSAAHEKALAMSMLQYLHERGIGVNQNFLLSYVWGVLAASKLPPGDTRTRVLNARDQLAARMTADQVAEAQRLASEWRPSEPPSLRVREHLWHSLKIGTLEAEQEKDEHRKARQALAENMTAEQVAESEDLARQWPLKEGEAVSVPPR